MLSDLRFAFRQILRAPGYATTVILILALGIGANTAIFSLLHSVLLKPVSYPEPERLMVLRQRHQETRDVSIAWPTYLDWRKDNRSFSALGLSQRDTYTLTGRDDAEQIMGAAVSAEYFQAIALRPELGRYFTTDEDRVGAPRVVVIRHALWQRKFGGTPGALGQSLTLNGKSYTVIGVMPSDMVTPRNAEFWIPITPLSDNKIWQDRGNNPGLFALGRLKPGVTLQQARADLKAIGLRINRDFPSETANLLPYVEPLVDSLTKNYQSSPCSAERRASRSRSCRSMSSARSVPTRRSSNPSSSAAPCWVSPSCSRRSPACSSGSGRRGVPRAPTCAPRCKPAAAPAPLRPRANSPGRVCSRSKLR